MLKEVYENLSNNKLDESYLRACMYGITEV